MRRQQLDRLKRKELAWYLAGFVAVQVGLAFALEWCWPMARDPEYTAKERLLLERLKEEPGRPLLLLMGSSRTALGINAARLNVSPDGPLVFNFGIPASGPMMELTCLERLLSAGVRPAMIVFEIMPLYLNQYGDRLLEERHLDSARLQGSEAAGLSSYCTHFDQWLLPWVGARLLPSYRHQAELRDAIGLDVGTARYPSIDALHGIDAYGWQPQNRELTTEQRRHLIDLALRQYRNVAQPFQLGAKPVRAVRDLLTFCRSHDIPTAILVMPEGSEFRALYDDDAKRSLDLFYDRICREFDVPLIDARTWVDDDGFYDGHHLLLAGTERFLDRFQREAFPGLLARLRRSTIGPLASTMPSD
jgi:hypothetical protein